MTPSVFPELGRELKASELVERNVYVLEKPGRPMVTMWFVRRRGDTAEFYAGVTRLVLLLLVVKPAETLEDDSGTRIRVFEYLGEV